MKKKTEKLTIKLNKRTTTHNHQWPHSSCWEVGICQQCEELQLITYSTLSLPRGVARLPTATPKPIQLTTEAGQDVPFKTTFTSTKLTFDSQLVSYIIGNCRRNEIYREGPDSLCYYWNVISLSTVSLSHPSLNRFHKARVDSKKMYELINTMLITTNTSSIYCLTKQGRYFSLKY